MASWSRLANLGITLLSSVLASMLLAGGAGAQRRPNLEIVPQLQHSSWVGSFAFSRDGKLLVSVGGDNTAKLWDVASGQMLRTFNHPTVVTSVAFSPDGGKIITGGKDDNTARLWDATLGEVLREFRLPASALEKFESNPPITSIEFSRDGKRLLTASGPLALWDVDSGRLLRTFEVKEWIHSAAFSLDGTRIFAGGGLTLPEIRVFLKIWDSRTGQLLQSLEGHGTSPIYGLAMSAAGTRLLSVSNNHTILWDALSGQLLHKRDGTVNPAIAFSPNGRQVVERKDRGFWIWDASTGERVRSFDRAGLYNSANSLAFSPDGASIVMGASGKLELWDVTTGQLQRTFEGRSDAVSAARFSPTGQNILTASGDMLKLWDVSSGQLVRTFEGHGGQVTSAVYSRDGRQIISGSGDKTLKLWGLDTGRALRTFVGHSLPVINVALSSDATRVASAGADNKVKIWDVATAKELHTLATRALALDLSSDGAHVVTSDGYGDIKLWETATGAPLRSFKHARYSGLLGGLAFSPDGKRLLASGGQTLKLWDVATGQLLHTFGKEKEGVDSAVVGFSPDGSRVVSGYADSTMKLWDATTGALLQTFTGHSGSIRSVDISSDGRRIVSAADDASVRFWDAHTGELLVTFFGWDRGNWLSITPKGFFAASGAGAQTVKLVRGLEFTVIDQFHQALFNPDLVRETLAGDPNGEVQGAAKLINLEKVLGSGPAPTVQLLSPADGSSVTTDLVTVQARITDRGKGVGRVEWRVNGITAAVGTKPAGSDVLTQELALDPGENRIEVVAFNGDNLLASLPARANIKFASSGDETKPKLHILAIGINAYVDRGWRPAGQADALAFPALALAVKDATTFGKDMKRAAAGLYADVRVTTVLDKEATRDNLDKVVTRLATEVHPRDTFVLFAAAHGKSESGRFYLIPQDHDGGPDPAALAKSAIDQTQLQDWLANRIKARKAIILLDTCESGALIAGHSRSRIGQPSSEAALGRLHEATGRPVLTAAAEDKPAFEGYEGHGVFTWALLDALKNGDRNGNGTIELSELVAHVQDQVPKIAAKLNGRGAAAIVVRGSTGDTQSARFGSKGEDFVLTARLQ